SVIVKVTGDTAVELDETYFVNLTSPSNATIADAQGAGTIVDDDLPELSVDDASVTEGDSGTVDATFTVTLSGATSRTVTVDYATADGTASAGSDYAAKSGGLAFAPGVTSLTVIVKVSGDTAVELDETYTLSLTNAVNATLADQSGAGTIVDDDGPT